MASHWLLASAQRRVMIESAPVTVECMPDCLSRWLPDGLASGLDNA